MQFISVFIMKMRLVLLIVLAALLLGGCASSSSPSVAQMMKQKQAQERAMKTRIDSMRPSSLGVPDKVYLRADPMPRPLNRLEVYRLVDIPDDLNEKTDVRAVVEFVVTEGGWIAGPEVIQGKYPALNTQVKNAIRYLRFEPGRHDGEPVAVRMRLPFSYNFKGLTGE